MKAAGIFIRVIIKRKCSEKKLLFVPAMHPDERLICDNNLYAAWNFIGIQPFYYDMFS